MKTPRRWIGAAAAALLGAVIGAIPAGAVEASASLYTETTRYANARWVSGAQFGLGNVVLSFGIRETVRDAVRVTTAYVSVRRFECPIGVLGGCPADLVMIPVDPEDIAFADEPTMTASIDTDIGGCHIDVELVGLDPAYWSGYDDNIHEDERLTIGLGEDAVAATPANASGDVCGWTDPEQTAEGSIAADSQIVAPKVVLTQ